MLSIHFLGHYIQAASGEKGGPIVTANGKDLGELALHKHNLKRA